jgi:uncharacterized membrane protein HdeD (DUF308 family)
MANQTSSPAPAGITIEGELLFLPQHNWRWFLLRGVLAIALGIFALFLPRYTVFGFAMLFAAFSFVDGVFSLVTGIRGATHHSQRWAVLILSGLIGIGVGVVFFAWPGLATMTYAFVLIVVLAIWAFTTGAFELAAAVRLRKQIEGEWLLGLSGALSLLLSAALIAILFSAPASILPSLGLLIGLYALASGAALVMLALRLRKWAA